MTKSTWNENPASDGWDTADNWTPPSLPVETATFGRSSGTAITFSATAQAAIKEIEFAEGAPAYSFTIGTSDMPGLTITGHGVANHSDRQQSFVVAATSSGYRDPQLKFINSATAGGDNLFYCAGPETRQGYGGGVICFCDTSSAGSASFKAWTGAGTPPKHHTVGGEIAFCDSASAESARFTIYGSLGDDGDTFGNVVFHDNTTAAKAVFVNVGGTVTGGDGGNTQFYGNSTAAHGLFNNWGGTHGKANGGDVAFDSTADGGYGRYYNHAAIVAGAYGGVTSFNNNPPDISTQGASAGHGAYFNYGAREGELGGGGHVEFSAKYGSPTAAHGKFVNYGSAIDSKSSAGHTIFSISLPTEYYPSAGNGTFWNHPGASEGAAAGFTEFSVYGSGSPGSNVPTAAEATFFNLGAYAPKAAGGYTAFSGASTAGNATLVAYGGTNGGHGGRIVFYGEALGGTANVQLFGDGELDIGSHTDGLTIGALELNGGVIVVQLGAVTTRLIVSGELTLHSTQTQFCFFKKDHGGFEFNKSYCVLVNEHLSALTPDRFGGNSIEGVAPTFEIVGNDLQVSYLKT